jgi:DNA processing protein
VGALSDAERLARLRLIRTERVGPMVFRRLIRIYGSGAASLDALPELARRGGGKRLDPCPREAAEAEIAALDRLGARLVLLGEADYPTLLAEVTDGPPALAVKGRLGLLIQPIVGVVGARNASAAGRRIAADIARGLGEAGYAVASGLARGIDAAAHQATLATGTIAVVAGGIDVAYPPENARLQDQIARDGALIAEQPPGTVPQATHFPRRNRVISGLARGLVVVEAAAGSGSLITARYAADQGREVFAVPGSPLDPRARGTNDLLRNGAVLTESAADVTAALQGWRPPPPPSEADLAEGEEAVPDEASTLEAARRAVLEALGPVPIEVDEILRQCQITPAVARIVLLELELAGRLERHPGNKVSGSFIIR